MRLPRNNVVAFQSNNVAGGGFGVLRIDPAVLIGQKTGNHAYPVLMQLGRKGRQELIWTLQNQTLVQHDPAANSAAAAPSDVPDADCKVRGAFYVSRRHS